MKYSKLDTEFVLKLLRHIITRIGEEQERYRHIVIYVQKYIKRRICRETLLFWYMLCLYVYMFGICYVYVCLQLNLFKRYLKTVE